MSCFTPRPEVWRLAEAAIAHGEVAADLQPVDIIRTFSSLLCFPFVGGRNLPPISNPSETADLVVRIFRQGLQMLPSEAEVG